MQKASEERWTGVIAVEEQKGNQIPDQSPARVTLDQGFSFIDRWGKGTGEVLVLRTRSLVH